jgi:RNA polymerase sigma-70 factor (ECF subfamily)
MDFDAVYDDYFDFMWSSLRGLGVADASLDDAVQEVFIVVHRRLPEFEGRSSLKTWLFGIAVGIARNHRRHLRRKGGLDALDERIEDKSASPLESASAAEAMQLVSRVLDGIDEDKRTVLVLTELEQMTAPEIAETLGVNVNTVYSRLRAARAEFDRAFARYRGRES